MAPILMEGLVYMDSPTSTHYPVNTTVLSGAVALYLDELNSIGRMYFQRHTFILEILDE